MMLFDAREKKLNRSGKKSRAKYNRHSETKIFLNNGYFPFSVIFIANKILLSVKHP